METEIPPFLREARERVAAALDRSPTALPAPEALVSELDRATHIVGRLIAHRQGHPQPGADADGASALTLRILELLRSEVLREWDDTGDRSTDGPTFVHVVRAFEEARELLAPPSDDLLGGAALDPWARELLGEVAHTLGSSFGSIVFLTEVLAEGQSGAVNPLQRKQLLILHRAALTVGSTAGDILRLAGPLAEPEESGEAAPFSVGDLLDEVSRVVGPIIEERRLELAVEAPSSSLRSGASFILKRVLTNLSLALAGVSGARRVGIRAAGEGAEVSFSVEVEGEIFEDDVHALTSTFPARPEGQGWRFSTGGLGVETAGRLVRALGGELQLAANPRERIRISFSITLPQEAEGNEPPL